MANESNLECRSTIANADLSGSQFYAVALTNAAKAAIAGAGVKIYGVVQNKPKSGEVATVAVAGRTKWVTGTGGLALGDRVMSDAAGKAVTWSTGSYDMGFCTVAATAGNTATVDLLPGGKT